MTTTVTAYVNLDRDNFLGWKPWHLIAEVATFTTPDRDEAIYSAEDLFHIGNRQGTDQDGAEWPATVRSLSVGDLVKVRSGDSVSFWVCARFGWDELQEPSNPVVRLDRAEIETAAAKLSPVLDERAVWTLRDLWRLAA